MEAHAVVGSQPPHAVVMAYLDWRRIDYVLTRSAQACSSPPARAQVLLADGRPWLVLAAGAPELAQVAHALGAQRVQAPTRAELLAHGMPASPPGFGRLLGVRTVLDSALLEPACVLVPSGVAGLWVQLDPQDLAAKECAVVAPLTGHGRGRARAA